MWVGGQHHAPAALPPQERPGTHCVGGWVGPRAGLDGCGKSSNTGIRSPELPARSESLYRLSYRGPYTKFIKKEKCILPDAQRPIFVVSKSKVSQFIYHTFSPQLLPISAMSPQCAVQTVQQYYNNGANFAYLW